ncbi:hypothetical protein AAFF_G00390880 [Aldrovandia affinis]|uniref:tRNA N(3)-cytidine methyltransferase n=1 Tax=Aldrovandia affinis TaxID=143900 RepID=A0AAD7R474_9TELE|nr:hypothetical protein AAFF_G00390880 [Aldrovandia affinis]
MAAPCAVGVADEGGCSETVQDPVDSAASGGRRPAFGTRFLKDPRQVFQHNAWDNVEWTEEQEVAARQKVEENSQPLPLEKQEEYDCRANEYWNDFYKIHENRFFKDRHWLFTEFPELAPKLPGSKSIYRILEVGCGVGNTVFPILKTNNDPGLFVYCCDFSNTAVELVKGNAEYDPERCFAFVHDLSDEAATFPVPHGTLDAIVLIFVLSALHPDKMQAAIRRLAQLLKSGGMLLLRDYGRYDMAQLRFKKGAGLSAMQNTPVQGLVDSVA